MDSNTERTTDGELTFMEHSGKHKLAMFFEKHRALLRQIIRFSVVGGTAFLVEYGCLILLTDYILPSFSLFPKDEGTRSLIAAPIAFIIAVIYNYVLSMLWVFEQRKDTSKKATFIIFVLLNIVALGLNQIFMWIFIKMFQMNFRIAKIITTAMVMVYNFVSRKIFIEDHSSST
ncbi:MAG: GtrA family protein [Lachnospiraceae bacterium]